MNETEPRSDDRNAILRLTQIIAFALIGGVVCFMVMVIAIRSGGKTGPFAAEPWNLAPPGGIISLIAVGMAVMCAALSFVIPRTVVANSRQAISKSSAAKSSLPQSFCGIYQLQMIVGMALLEGSAFFNLIALMIEGRIPNLIATVLLIGLMATMLPTRDRLDGFVEEQEGLLATERQSSDL